MSQLSFTTHNEPENQLHHRNVKQFGVSEFPRSTTKKTALTDVKNILAQKVFHSAKKIQTSATKSEIPKKNLFTVFNDKENGIAKKETKKQGAELTHAKEETTTVQDAIDFKATSNDPDVGCFEPVCAFCDKAEDDYADILFKSIKLSKSEIDILALEWEGPSVVSEKDMREIEVPYIPNVNASVPDFRDMFGCENNELDFSLLYDIPIVESINLSAEFEECSL